MIKMKLRMFANRLSIFSIVLGLTALSQGFFPARAQTNEPLEKANKNLSEAKLDEALHWFELSLQDFPNAPGAVEARFQTAMLLTAKELTFAKLLKLWTEGSKLERIENGDSKIMIEVHYYEDEDKKLLAKLKAFAKQVCAKTSPLTLTLKLPKLDGDTEVFRTRIKKGEWLHVAERNKLELAEWKLNYTGLLKETLPNFSEAEENLQLDGAAKWEVLFHAIGTRLMIAQDYYKKEQLAPSAVPCFEKAMELTKDNRYGDIYQKSKEALQRIK